MRRLAFMSMGIDHARYEMISAERRLVTVVTSRGRSRPRRPEACNLSASAVTSLGVRLQAPAEPTRSIANRHSVPSERSDFRCSRCGVIRQTGVWLRLQCARSRHHAQWRWRARHCAIVAESNGFLTTSRMPVFWTRSIGTGPA
jgi:hypothetical protein